MKQEKTMSGPLVPLPKPWQPSGEVRCPVCRDQGWLRRDVPPGHPLFGKIVRCACQQEGDTGRLRARTFCWLGANEEQVRELQALTFASFKPQANGQDVLEAYTRTRRYAHDLKQDQVTGQRNLLLLGPYGVGKTHLACAILNEARQAGVGCLFLSGNEFFQKLYDSDFDENLLKQAIETPLLCLDDLDKMQLKGDGSYQKATLFTLFNQRYLTRRPVIITANKDDDWQNWLHGAILSRLFGHAEVIGMQGQDYRLIQAMQKNGIG